MSDSQRENFLQAIASEIGAAPANEGGYPSDWDKVPATGGGFSLNRKVG